MRAIGGTAATAGVALAVMIVITTRKEGFTIRRSLDGQTRVEPWLFSATIDIDDDLNGLLAEVLPGDRGDLILFYHPILPLRYDRVCLERGAGRFDYSRGRARYWLSVGGVSAAPLILWLIVLAVTSALGGRREAPRS